MSQSWEEFVAGLTPAQRDHMLHEVLKWQIEDLGVDGDVKFIAHNDPDGGAGPDGEAVSDIFWVTCGESLVPAATEAVPAQVRLPLTVGALRRHFDCHCKDTDRLEFLAAGYVPEPNESRVRLLFESADSPGFSDTTFIRLQQAAPAIGDDVEPATETCVATVNHVRIMVNTAKGIGLLCRSVQLVSTPTHHHFKSTVIFNQLTGPSAVINSFIESLQSPEGRQSVLMNCAAGLLRVLENVKAAEVSRSVASGDITIIERVTAVSTTKLELPAKHDY